MQGGAAGLYAARVADLAAVLNEPEMATDAIEVMRCLIEQIVLTPEDRPCRCSGPTSVEC